MRERFTKLALRGLFKAVVGPPVPLAFQRGWTQALTVINPPARGVARERQRLGGVDCETLSPRDGEVARTMVFLHGGAYVLGSPATQRAITSHIAALAQARVIVPDYRLAPEHPWPAAIEDGMQVMAAVAECHGAFSLGGDSAGGGLALCCAQRARDAGQASPTALVLISPWVDLSNSLPSHRERAARDPMLRGDWSAGAAAAYVAEQGPLDDPRWSPLFGEQRGLPPTLIHVGSEELLHDDAEALAEALRAADVPVSLEVFEGLWHEFHMHAALLPRAREGVQRIADFLQRPA
jgi:acetyl esterase/lipase